MVWVVWCGPTHYFVNPNLELRLGWAVTKIVEGCGNKGGGFIFETQTIHRGTPEGEDSRTTLTMEYHNSVKCSIARELGLGLPCPSGDQYIVNSII